MNQTIKELALEAFQPINDITTEGVADRNTFDQAWFQLYNQKFAELIVRQCLNQCYHRGMNDELYAGQLKAAAYIEQHFGVEE